MKDWREYAAFTLVGFYHVYDRLGSDDAVEVLAFWHTSRGHGPELRKEPG